MAVPIDTAAKYISMCSGWKSTNLELQKMLYLVQMIFYGRKNRLALDTEFEAWDYGPVSPELYHKLKGFGAKVIPEVVFWDADDLEDDEVTEILKDACANLLTKGGTELIRNTHWSGGAWAKKYVPGANVKITSEDMLYEFKNRQKRSKKAA